MLSPDSSEIESTTTNQKQLYNLILANLREEDSIEIFGAWAGDEDVLEGKSEALAEDLLKEDFYFKEKELLIVRK